jgi:hypothetical protein
MIKGLDKDPARYWSNRYGLILAYMSSRARSRAGLPRALTKPTQLERMIEKKESRLITKKALQTSGVLSINAEKRAFP